MASLVKRLARHARPQFHLPLRLVVWWPFFLLLMYGLRWLLTGIHWVAGERVVSNFRVLALMSGIAIAGEWVRAVVKLWLRRSPAQGSLVATAVAGAAVGALFDGYMMIMWGNDGWRELLVCAAIGTAAYVTVDLCLRWEERSKARR